MDASAQGAGAAGEQATREFPPVGSAAGDPAPDGARAGDDVDTFAQRPELFVGAAFVGGLVLAQVLKRVGR